MAIFYTIGHSTRTLEDFVATLRAHDIKNLVDIRSLPASRRLPHFNRESLNDILPGQGITYRWMKSLGGRRLQILQDSPNIALRSASFRNYADYMLTAKFSEAIRELTDLAEVSRTAYMCAERDYFRCHRMLVSDYLVSAGNDVLHIANTGEPQKHRMSAEARRLDGKLVYICGELFAGEAS